MKIDLLELNGKMFDSVEVGREPPQELIVFADRAWKEKSAKVWQEIRSTFVALPPVFDAYSGNRFTGVPRETPGR